MPAGELVLHTEPDAAARARRFASRTLPDSPPEVLDAVRLVVSELVTNAALHGAPPVVVRARSLLRGVRLEVQDAGDQLPVLPQQSHDAMTGRGLALVAALSGRWGVARVPEGGKVVWAELGTDDVATCDDGAALERVLAGWEDGADPGEQECTVDLGRVPTSLLLAAKRHLDDLVRELTLERSAGAERSPGTALIDVVTGAFSRVRSEIKRQALRAAAAGERETELVLTLSLSSAEAGERYLAALEEVDRYARAARLLSLETPPEHRVFRTWWVGEVLTSLRACADGRTPPPVRPLVEVLLEQVGEVAALRRTADRLTLLQRVNADLTRARDVSSAARVVVTHATEALGAVSARVYLARGTVLQSVAVLGGRKHWVERFQDLHVDRHLPGPEVFRTGTAVLLHSRAQAAERFPELTDVFETERCVHVAPLALADRRLGVLSIAFPPAGPRDQDTLGQFVTALADALAQALERLDGSERLQLLADASVALSASLDVRQTAHAVARLLVPRLADWCVVQLVRDGRLETVAVLHADPEKARWAREISDRYPPPMDATAGAPAVLRSGTSELWEDLPPEVLEASAVDEEHLRLLQDVGMGSALVVPLPGRGRTLGVVTLIYAESGRRYTPADVPYVEDVARRAGLALETAGVLSDQAHRLADVERVAEAAQKAILAPPPARLGAVALAARYVSAAAEARIGGDLYAVVEREGAVRLLIGDVRGKGLAAVRTATVVLGEFRAAAADVADLAGVARQMDRRVTGYLGEEDFVTCLLVEVADDGALLLASCGHPPPVLVSGGAISSIDVPPSLPLGLGADPVLVRGRMQRGDRLLLHTDGITEARLPDRSFVALPRVAAPLVVEPTLSSALDVVLARLHEAVGPDLGDDLALLAAEYLGPAGG